ncbi:gibberellin 2-beta-dioxygenase 8 isoform X2 [Brachypodium distachyon]|uniref:gibberellin 2-beta-dioxygenase 8 isoform X2 n=1 Tax=Brachypodium distachyon TaxID=15368 RepID=UPI000D0CA073|nr:gibberellin 2-beta-dioxygenase 8 isoform X2 [Brachypodium distachyon]|eukprot:XP_024311464.1 gibberellin 2-beta-dioxygenase 8 isoform X2 [Brachypodium distachyon]
MHFLTFVFLFHFQELSMHVSDCSMEDHEYEQDESNPPLLATYKHLLDGEHRRLPLGVVAGDEEDDQCDLPVIDLAPLLLDLESDQQTRNNGGSSSAACRAAMVRAASEWGFFQVTNHGVPQPLLDELHGQQLRAFRRPFHRKLAPGDGDDEDQLLLSPEAYRWGNPTATCLHQLSWSEAYHVPITTPSPETKTTTATRRVIHEVSAAMSKLARRILSVLAAEHGPPPETETTTCFLRLNRYPQAPGSGGGHGHGVLGLCGHTDSDFLTILRQDDHVGGLQLLLDDKDGGRRWRTVRPNPGALTVNVGDLLQAWTNDVYASVEHRVVARPDRERFSVAFFLCPSYDTLIRPPLPGKTTTSQVYRNFTFGEYRSQVREDVRLTGRKVGLPRFRRHVSPSPASLTHQLS